MDDDDDDDVIKNQLSIKYRCTLFHNVNFMGHVYYLSMIRGADDLPL